MFKLSQNLYLGPDIRIAQDHLGGVLGQDDHIFIIGVQGHLGNIAVQCRVIINDAVVFLAKFNSLVKDDGYTVYEAAYEAGLSRFRAIMLTSLTTVLGLYPLIKETSFQAQFLIPMAISVAYGVLIGTFIILVFFPVLILFFNDVRRAFKWLWTGKKPTREEVERVLMDEERLEEYRESA